MWYSPNCHSHNPPTTQRIYQISRANLTRVRYFGIELRPYLSVVYWNVCSVNLVCVGKGKTKMEVKEMECMCPVSCMQLSESPFLRLVRHCCPRSILFFSKCPYRRARKKSSRIVPEWPTKHLHKQTDRHKKHAHTLIRIQHPYSEREQNINCWTTGKKFFCAHMEIYGDMFAQSCHLTELWAVGSVLLLLVLLFSVRSQIQMIIMERAQHNSPR